MHTVDVVMASLFVVGVGDSDGDDGDDDWRWWWWWLLDNGNDDDDVIEVWNLMFWTFIGQNIGHL